MGAPRRFFRRGGFRGGRGGGGPGGPRRPYQDDNNQVLIIFIFCYFIIILLLLAVFNMQFFIEIFRIMNTTKMMMEETDPVHAIVAATPDQEHEVMDLQELTVKVTMILNKK